MLNLILLLTIFIMIIERKLLNILSLRKLLIHRLFLLIFGHLDRVQVILRNWKMLPRAHRFPWLASFVFVWARRLGIHGVYGTGKTMIIMVLLVFIMIIGVLRLEILRNKIFYVQRCGWTVSVSRLVAYATDIAVVFGRVMLPGHCEVVL